MNHTDNDMLLEQIKKGDVQAYNDLFSRHRKMLKRAIRLRIDPLLQARLDESDIVQETHLEAFRRLPDYLNNPQRIAFRLWLHGIACDRLLNRRRDHLDTKKRSVRREFSLPDASASDLGCSLIAKTSSPSEQLNKKELGKQVRQGIAELPKKDQEIILLRNFEGLSNQESSELIGIDHSAASKRYGRALLRLREILQVEEGNEP